MLESAGQLVSKWKPEICAVYVFHTQLSKVRMILLPSCVVSLGSMLKV
jgi:hypothetical protein